MHKYQVIFESEAELKGFKMTTADLKTKDGNLVNIDVNDHVIELEQPKLTGNKRYAIIFESDSTELNDLIGKDVNIPSEVFSHVCGTLRELPPRTPCNVYSFENFVNGYGRGNNDVLDKLEGKNGEYEGGESK